VFRNFIKEKFDSGLIAMMYIPTRLLLANALIKGLPAEKLQELTCNLGMIETDITHQLERVYCVHNHNNYRDLTLLLYRFLFVVSCLLLDTILL